VLSTDTFVVNPLEFPGGDIGTLAVNGTVNDLAMMGATPCYLTAGFIIEEGLAMETLDRVVASMAEAARIAGVQVVAGDTKVVEHGKGDGLFINTTGLGIASDFRPVPTGARPGDAVIVSGAIGVHGITILSAREGLEFQADLSSDTACLYPLVETLRRATDNRVGALRDPTRGGVASALNEIAVASGVGVVLEESSLPVPRAVAGACEMLGLDPLYVANEGVFVAFLPASLADDAVTALRNHPLGRDACRIGRVVDDHPGMVVMRSALGGTRIVDMLPGDQLPRIC
jgi:hydrogenase expression/formation protein HypE